MKKFEKFWIKFKKENLINFKEEENKLEIYKILMHKLMNINLMIDRVPFSFEKIELNENFFENQVDRLESFLFHFLKFKSVIILQ